MAAWHHSGRITGRNVVVTGGSRCGALAACAEREPAFAGAATYVLSRAATYASGPCRGIGLGLVKLFLGAGNTVTATTRKADTAGQLHSLMQEHKGRLQARRLV